MSKTRDYKALEWFIERNGPLLESEDSYAKAIREDEMSMFKAGWDACDCLQERLKEAEEALEFYADRTHWDEFDCAGHRPHFLAEDEDHNGAEPANHRDWAGGKRARAYFEKWGKE